jgi:uncharacterized protein YPO0396
MSDEEINRKFDVIAGHMATLAVQVEQIGEKVDALADAQTRAEKRWEQTEGSIRALLAIQELQAGEIKDLSAAVRAIDERTRHSDERLDVLINTVERFISEGRNGQG